MRFFRIIIVALALALSAFIAPLCKGETFDVLAGEIAAGKLPDPLSITSLTLHGSVNAADLNYIASNCRSLRSLDLSAVSVEPCKLAKRHETGVCEFPGGVLPAYSLAGLTAFELRLPESITEICDGALLSASVADLTIPDGVVAIGRGAFASCRSLKTVKVGAAIITIGEYAFSDCINLTRVSLNPKLKEIGARAFSACVKLADLEIGPDPALVAIDDDAFSSTALSELDLSACRELRRIGSRAFADCDKLESVSLPDGINEIGQAAFFACPSLISFNLPRAMAELPPMALTGAEAMTETDALLHDGVKQLGDYSLAGLNSATAIALPAGLEKIGTGAFEGWTALGKVLAEELQTVPALGHDVWAGVDQPDAELIVAKGREADFAAADQWKEFKIRNSEESGIGDITLPGDEGSNIYARFIDGVLELRAGDGIDNLSVYDIDGHTLFNCSGQGDNSLKVTTGLQPGRVYIIGLQLASGRTAGLKLINENAR